MTDTNAATSHLSTKATVRALTRELPESFRELRVEVLTESLAHGVPVSPLALTIVLSAIDEQLADPWSPKVADIEALLWCGVSQFCADAALELPPTSAEALHAVLATGMRIGWFTADADCPKRLFAPFQQMQLGARRPGPTRRGAQ